MDATTQEPQALLEIEQIESSVDLPSPEEYVPCEQCDSVVKNGVIVSNRSYMFFYFMEGLLAFCKHHGEKNQERLEELGAHLVLDTRERLIENRLQGQL